MTTPRRTTCFILSLALLCSCSVIGPAAPERIVRVKALADPRFRERDPRWVEKARGLIESASDYFEREFGVRFVTQAVRPWPLKERLTSTSLLLRRLKEEVPLKDEDRSYDLIIAFTGELVNAYAGLAWVDRIGDCREGLGNYLVSAAPDQFQYRGPYADLERDVVALIHELGHIFGAEHTRERGSIMHENFDYRVEFDKKNREVILKNKFCPFGKG